jgi:AraC-like DNA-binding protein
MKDRGGARPPMPEGPGRRLSSSAGLGWRHAVERHLDPAQLEQFAPAVSFDLLVVLVTAGRYTIESRREGRWRSADFSPGSVAVTAPGASPAQRDRISRDPGALSDRELKQVVEYMHARIGDDLDLARLAALVNLSKYHFLRMFAKATGVTPHRYLVDLRLQHGADLLRTNRAMSVKQIAMTCGYRSPSQFAASFRRRYGLLPTQYRR